MGPLVEIADTVVAGAPPQQARKWWTGEIARLANGQDAEPASPISSALVLLWAVAVHHLILFDVSSVQEAIGLL